LEQQSLKNAGLQGFCLKNRKSLQAQVWSKTVRFSAQSISFGTGSTNHGGEKKKKTANLANRICYALISRISPEKLP
jgi:hypothetical protein